MYNNYTHMDNKISMNPRHACAARVTVVGLSVYLSVDAYSGTTGHDVAYWRYQQHQNYVSLKT